MKILRLILLSTLSMTLLCSEAIPNLTDWTDPLSGTKYDFSSLKKDPK